MKSTISLILGGGRGERLYPLTMYRSKPAVPFGGKYRLIDIPISLSVHAGLNKIFVLTQFNSTSLNRHISNTYKFDSFRKGFVEILAASQSYHSEEWFKGTADAVRKTFSTLKDYNSKNILILSGDHLYKMDLKKMIKYHKKVNADITVATTMVPKDQASGFGLMKINSGNQIIDFKEKPKGVELEDMEIKNLPKDKPYLASMGIYIFKTKILEEALKNEEVIDFGKDIIPNSLKNHRVYAFLHDDYWRDIGTIRAYYDANIDLTRKDAPFSFFDPQFPIYTHARYLPPTQLENSIISSSNIADGCIIDKCFIQNSIIGLRTIIKPESEIYDSLILGADYYQGYDVSKSNFKKLKIGIDEKCVIRKAILDKNVYLGKRVQIINKKKQQNFDSKDYYIRDGIVVIPKNTHIADGTII